jgi:hypothetical protein
MLGNRRSLGLLSSMPKWRRRKRKLLLLLRKPRRLKKNWNFKDKLRSRDWFRNKKRCEDSRKKRQKGRELLKS